mmetsp:Transcript_5703/g.35521  ORF Transcript_5703/g.35521 Transcript_5703/m.35521 type:complete len:202 (+) Transcript_5703:1132-1737(+)
MNRIPLFYVGCCGFFLNAMLDDSYLHHARCSKLFFQRFEPVSLQIEVPLLRQRGNVVRKRDLRHNSALILAVEHALHMFELWFRNEFLQDIFHPVVTCKGAVGSASVFPHRSVHGLLSAGRLQVALCARCARGSVPVAPRFFLSDVEIDKSNGGLWKRDAPRWSSSTLARVPIGRGVDGRRRTTSGQARVVLMSTWRRTFS